MTFMYYGIKVKTRVLYPFDVFGKFYFVWREWSGFFVVVIFNFYLYFIIFTTLEDGGWSSWEEWSSCSVSCGVGVHSRSRTCSNPAPLGGGKDCSGNSIESSNCDAGICAG